MLKSKICEISKCLTVTSLFSPKFIRPRKQKENSEKRSQSTFFHPNSSIIKKKKQHILSTCFLPRQCLVLRTQIETVAFKSGRTLDNSYTKYFLLTFPLFPFLSFLPSLFWVFFFFFFLLREQLNIYEIVDIKFGYLLFIDPGFINSRDHTTFVNVVKAWIAYSLGFDTIIIN